MKKRDLAFIPLLCAAFLLLRCAGNDALISEDITPVLQPTISAKTPSLTLQPRDSTVMPTKIISDNSIIAIASKDYGTIFLVDVSTGQYRKISLEGDTAVNAIGWTSDGCALYIETEKQRIIKVDLNGDLITEMANAANIKLEGQITQFGISPDEQWMTLIQGMGYHGYTSYEFQNLITVSLQNPTEAHRISEQKSVSDATWKPNSNQIAFTDKDALGVHQIYITFPTGVNRIQLTHFDKTGPSIRSLKWSPGGQKIAFVIVDNEKHESHLSIVDVSSDADLISITSIAGVNNFFWSSNDVIVADMLLDGRNPNTITNRTIAWFDSNTGNELGKIDSTNLPNGIFELLGPLASSNQIAFFSGSSFYAYEITSRQMEKGFDQFSDMRYWLSRPEITEEQICK